MSRVRVVTVLTAVACLAGLVGVTAGDSTGTRERGWWAAGWRPVSQQKAAAKPNPAAVAAKARLDSTSATPWHVGWNEATGLAEGVWGPISGPQAGTPEEAAEQFLRKYRPLFAGLAPEADPQDIVFVRGGTHTIDDSTKSVVFGEHYKGVPVNGATLHVHVRRGWHVVGAGGSPYRIESLDVTPTLSVQAAIEALQAAVAPDSARVSGEPRILIYPSATPPRLAYVFYTGILDRGPFSVFVDAKSGEMLLIAPEFFIDGPGVSRGKDPASADSLSRRPGVSPKKIQIRNVPEEEWRAAKRGGRGPQFRVHFEVTSWANDRCRSVFEPLA